MNKWTKVSLLSTGLVLMMGLTACQTTPSNTQQQKSFKGDRQLGQDRRGMDMRGKDHRNFHSHNLNHRGSNGRQDFRRIPLTEEQRVQVEKIRTERLAQRAAQKQAIQQACEGKTGQTISLQVGEKTVQGVCQMQFRPTSSKATTLPQTTPQSTTTATPSAS